MLLLESSLAAAGIGFFSAASVCAVTGLLRPRAPERSGPGVPLLLALGCAPLIAVLVLHGANTGRVPLFSTFDALTVYGVFITLAALCVLTRHRTQGVLAILAPYVTLLLIAGVPSVGATPGAIPLADLLWVVLIRWRIGQPFYQGDTNHLSHRLVRRGLTRTQAVLAIWLAAAALAVLAYLC